jgi:hypothetical protein
MKRLLLTLALALISGAAFAQATGPATFRPYSLAIGSGTKTATATAGAATLNQPSGKITTEALSTAAGATYTLTITDSQIAATDIVFASPAWGTNSAGETGIIRVTPGAGSVVIIVKNTHASAALNGTIVVSFAVIKSP